MGEHEAPVQDHMLGNQLYDTLKFFALIAFPAFAAAYFSIAQIWGLPYAQEVVGTITVIDTFLGVLLGISTKSYDKSDAKYDGNINVVETDATKKFELELKTDPHDLDKKQEVLFKVKPTEGA